MNTEEAITELRDQIEVESNFGRKLSPSAARHVCRWACWYKQARTIESATTELARRLAEGQPHGTVYACPFARPGDPHWHLSGYGKPYKGTRQVPAVFAALGDAAYRVDDDQVRPDADVPDFTGSLSQETT